MNLSAFEFWALSAWLGVLTGVMGWLIVRQTNRIDARLESHDSQLSSIGTLLAAETAKLRELIHSVSERVVALEVWVGVKRRHDDAPGDVGTGRRHGDD